MTFTDPMITNIARAFRWQALIDSGKFSNVHELVHAEDQKKMFEIE